MACPYALPEVFESDDWGPTAACIPAELQHLPFAPFSKSDKVGRASDWTQAAYQKFSGGCCSTEVKNCCLDSWDLGFP